MKRYNDDWATMIIVTDAAHEYTVLIKEDGPKSDWKFPCGTREAGEKPEDTARRELKEETGLTATKLAWLYTQDRGNHDLYIYAAYVKSLADLIPRIEEQDGTNIETWKVKTNEVGHSIRIFSGHYKALREAKLLSI